MSLELATLQRITGLDRSGKNATATPKTDGDAIPVQFNPATLRISRRNNVDRGGVTTGTQKRQHPAQENSTLSFDLEFDTAEQGSGGEYVDVRRWTALVRQFVEPPPGKPKDPPPGVRFAWGTLIYDGLIGEIVEELDYFAPDGTPLHAKVSVKIEEQNFQYEANAEGGGSRDAKTATDPGRPPSPTTSGGGAPPPGTAPGSSGTSRPQQIVQAQAGESVQDVLSRTGLDPNAWRAAMQDLDSPLSLPAGAPVQLGAEIFAGAGIGLTAGFAAEPAPTSPAALASALGVDLPPGDALAGQTVATAGAAAGPDPRAAGLALSAAGGLSAAASLVAAATASQAAAQARGSFAVPGATAPDGDPAQAGGPDRRALSYGRSIPLRARAAPSTGEPPPGTTATPGQRGGDATPASMRRQASLRWRPGDSCA